MTAAQRRTVTVTIGGDEHHVTVTAEVREPEDLVKLAAATFEQTRPERRMQMGFGSQVTQISPDRNPAGTPVYHYGGPPEAKEG